MSERDAAAYKKIYDLRAERLVRASTRAEKWIAGLSALVAVLTTAIIVKGPEDFAKSADGSARGVVLGLMIAGVVGISGGLISAYSAAFGGLFSNSKIDTLIEKPPTQAGGAAMSFDDAATADANSSRLGMRIAVVLTVIAMISLMSAVAISWVATPSDTSTSTTCIKGDAGVIEIAGAATIKSGTGTIVDCP